MSLNQVYERTQRSRLHLDLYTNNKEAEVKRLVKIWENRYPWRYIQGAGFVVLEDPDDDLFCVVQIERDLSLKPRIKKEQNN